MSNVTHIYTRTPKQTCIYLILSQLWHNQNRDVHLINEGSLRHARLRGDRLTNPLSQYKTITS